MRQFKLSSVIIMTWPNQYPGFGIVWSLSKDTAIRWSWEHFVDGGKIRRGKAGVFDHPANSWWVFQLASIKSDLLSCKMVGSRASYDNQELRNVVFLHISWWETPCMCSSVCECLDVIYCTLTGTKAETLRPKLELGLILDLDWLGFRPRQESGPRLRDSKIWTNIGMEFLPCVL